MRSPFIFSLVITLVLINTVNAQLVAGVWRGRSLCQVKNSPCHDETVVYHITKLNDSLFDILANKIVEGKEDTMGIITCHWVEHDKLLFSIDSVRNARWEFRIAGNTMKGTLVYKGTLYRKIDVKRDN